MKVITIVLEQQDKTMKFSLFNEKDQSGMVTEKEQEWADEIENGFKEFTKLAKLLEEQNETI